MQRVMACSTVDGPGWQLGRRNEARASDVREGSRHRAWMEHPIPKGNRCTRDGDGDGDAIFGIASPSGPRRGHLQYNTHGIQDDCCPVHGSLASVRTGTRCGQ